MTDGSRASETRIARRNYIVGCTAATVVMLALFAVFLMAYPD